MKRIIVTGCAGFIGSSVSKELLVQGHRVLGIDNLSPYYNINIKKSNVFDLKSSKKFFFLEKDINYLTVQDLGSQKWDLCIHLAATPGVLPSLNREKEYHENNVKGTSKLLAILNQAGIKKIIFASSSSVYKANGVKLFQENENETAPLSPYGYTKLKGESLIKDYHKKFGFDVLILRLFSVYGPKLRPDLALFKFATSILENKPITVYGDGSSQRDYTNIKDVIKGILSAIHLMVENDSVQDTINIGNGNPIKLNVLIKLIEKELKETAKINYIESKAAEMQFTGADISKAKSILSYKPDFDIKEGISDFIQWFQENRKTYDS